MTIHNLKIFAAILLLAAATGSRSRAQQQEQKPEDANLIIRTETRVVLVDAVVTDKKGGYVRDLKQKDFKVYEDGKEMQVKSFSFEADPNSPISQQPRYIILFFDNSTSSFAEQKLARDAAAKFIDANAAPNRLMAVVNYGGTVQLVQNFTSSAERLKAAVSGIRTSVINPNERSTTGLGGGGLGQAGVPSIPSPAASFGVQSILMDLRAFAKSLSSVPGRKSLILFTGGFVVNQEHISELTACIDACNRANVAIYPIDVRGLVAGIAKNEAPSIFQPAGFDGQPTFITWPMYLAWQARGGAGGGGVGGGGAAGGGAGGGGAAGGRGGASGGAGAGAGGASGGRGGAPGGTGGTAGGVGRGGAAGTTGGANTGRGGGGGAPPVNPMNPNLMNPNFNAMRNLIPKFPESAQTNQQVMYALADGTGGFVIVNTNDLLGGLEKIGKEMSEFYLLGYTPPESDEGSCHNLHVKVEKGLNVRARTGYCNAKQKDVLSKTTTEQTLENRVAANQPGSLTSTIQLPFFYTSPNIARVTVAMEMAPGDLKVEKDKNGKLLGVINVLGIATKPDGSVAARFSDAVKLTFETKKNVDEFKQSKYHYENQFDVAAGKYTLKVAFNSGGESFGKVESPLQIDPYDGKTFMISGLALSSKYGAAGQMGGLLDAALIEDRTPLVTHGVQVIPAGTSAFKKGETPVVYVEVYDPQAAQPELPKDFAIAMQFLILDAKTNEQKADSGLFRIPVPDKATGSPVINFANKIPSEELAPGSYILEVKAFNNKNQGLSRKTAIEFK